MIIIILNLLEIIEQKNVGFYIFTDLPIGPAGPVWTNKGIIKEYLLVLKRIVIGRLQRNLPNTHTHTVFTIHIRKLVLDCSVSHTVRQTLVRLGFWGTFYKDDFSTFLQYEILKYSLSKKNGLYFIYFQMCDCKLK
jgi:hypothetical protein